MEYLQNELIVNARPSIVCRLGTQVVSDCSSVLRYMGRSSIPAEILNELIIFWNTLCVAL